MPPDPSPEEDEQYLSEEDSDFAPDEAREAPFEQSDSDDDEAAPGKTKRSRPAEAADAQDDGYDNSGDEAIIAKGHKRRKRAHNRGEAADDDEGGEGGLVKTRAQRAAEYDAVLQPKRNEKLYLTLLIGRKSANTPSTVDL